MRFRLTPLGGTPNVSLERVSDSHGRAAHRPALCRAQRSFAMKRLLFVLLVVTILPSLALAGGRYGGGYGHYGGGHYGYHGGHGGGWGGHGHSSFSFSLGFGYSGGPG